MFAPVSRNCTPANFLVAVLSDYESRVEERDYKRQGVHLCLRIHLCTSMCPLPMTYLRGYWPPLLQTDKETEENTHVSDLRTNSIFHIHTSCLVRQPFLTCLQFIMTKYFFGTSTKTQTAFYVVHIGQHLSSFRVESN